jgi:hypothetical protein
LEGCKQGDETREERWYSITLQAIDLPCFVVFITCTSGLQNRGDPEKVDLVNGQQ